MRKSQKENNSRMFDDATKDRVSRWIAGDIAISDDPGSSIKRWRKKFDINQNTLAGKLDISPSVISDYESGRRKSPGTGIIKKIVRAFIKSDEERGGQVTKAFANRFEAHLPTEVVRDISEFENSVNGEKFLEIVEGKVVANGDLLNKGLFGYTVIDGPKAILELTTTDFAGLFGVSRERALIFTNVSTGRSPMVAIKVRGMTPGVIVLHGNVDKPDKLAIRIAEDLKVPLVVSNVSDTEKLIDNLQKNLS